MNKTTTIFPKTILDMAKEKTSLSVFKSASTNKKLSGIKDTGKSAGKAGKYNRITRGKYKGYRMYALTLVERETCSTACEHWHDCYGNNLYLAKRYRLDLDRLKSDLDKLAQKEKGKFILRLHILGDFSTVEYIQFYLDSLVRYPDMVIFGYSRSWDNPELRPLLDQLQNHNRVHLRYSGMKSETMTALSMDSDYTKKLVADKKAFVCPVQAGSKIDACMDCGLCFNPRVSTPVAFITH